MDAFQSRSTSTRGKGNTIFRSVDEWQRQRTEDRRTDEQSGAVKYKRDWFEE